MNHPRRRARLMPARRAQRERYQQHVGRGRVDYDPVDLAHRSSRDFEFTL
jgi:hypothetical protein